MASVLPAFPAIVYHFSAWETSPKLLWSCPNRVMASREPASAAL